MRDGFNMEDTAARGKRVKISVDALSLWYGEKQALKEIRMEIETHTVTALIGPSGCGKSTFLRCLNRMNDGIQGMCMEGKVLLDGEDIYGKGISPVQLRKRVGMVFQQPNPFPMSIYENIVYGPKLHGIRDRKRLGQIVESSLRGASIFDEVKDILKKSALGLSGGQQQRLCIARALAAEPEVLLMDEPTSALDPVSTQKIEELIRKLKEAYTIVIVTHNLQQASRIADNAAFFLSGELIEYGTADAVFCRPRNQKTEQYLTGRFG